jgi:hypothetical protein
MNIYESLKRALEQAIEYENGNEENVVYLHSGNVLTKEQTDTLYELTKILPEDWIKLGYTKEEAEELSKASEIYQ